MTVLLDGINLATFRSRVQPFLPELGYAVLFDRTDRSQGEERLGQWPVVRGTLPHTDADSNVRDLWAWVTQAIDDAMALHTRRGVFRVRLYAHKGNEVLDNLTLKTEPPEPEDDVFATEDESGELALVPEQDPSGPERASTLVLNGAERFIRMMERMTDSQLKIARQQQAQFDALLSQLGEQVLTARQQVQDLLDVLVADRMETANERLAAAAAEPAKRGKDKALSPVAQEAIKSLGDVLKDVVVGAVNMPDGLKGLLGHPRAKALLSDPRLPRLLQDHPEAVDQLVGFLEPYLDHVTRQPSPGPGAGAPDDADPYDLPDPDHAAHP